MWNQWLTLALKGYTIESLFLEPLRKQKLVQETEGSISKDSTVHTNIITEGNISSCVTSWNRFTTLFRFLCRKRPNKPVSFVTELALGGL